MKSSGSSVENCYQVEDIEIVNDHTRQEPSNGIGERAKVSEINWNRKSIYRAWLLLCFTTGPVSSMSRTYIPSAIQAIAWLKGETREGDNCSVSNDCYVRLGNVFVNYNSYVLYLKAISTALEGVVAIFVSSIADYSDYRKWLLIISIILYGAIAVPSYAFKEKNNKNLIGLSTIYCLLNIDSIIYQILEGSYIPLFMRSARPEGIIPEEVRRKIVLKRGSVVSVMGIVLGNCGGLCALLIGIIITVGVNTQKSDGYSNYLLAITIAGCITVVSAIVCVYCIPSVNGKVKPRKGNFLILCFKRYVEVFKSIQKYRNAFIFCIYWVIWDVSYTNFLSVFVLLFRSQLGIQSTTTEYTIFSFASYIVASIGSLSWVILYPRLSFNIKFWGYLFLTFSVFANFWGFLGINRSVSIGFKNRWEFWLFEIFYTSSSSALRSLNRVIYSSLLPEGEEAQYFGLEIFLGVATGWIGSLVNAVIQDKTLNYNYPFLPNIFLCLISLGFYYSVDTESKIL